MSVWVISSTQNEDDVKEDWGEPKSCKITFNVKNERYCDQVDPVVHNDHDWIPTRGLVDRDEGQHTNHKLDTNVSLYAFHSIVKCVFQAC